MASRRGEKGSGLVQRMHEQAWWLRLSLLAVEARFTKLTHEGADQPEEALLELTHDTAELLHALGKLLASARLALSPETPDQATAEDCLLLPPGSFSSIAGETDASLLQLAFLVQELRTIASTSTPSSEEAAAEVDRIWASFYCAPPPT